MLLRQRLKRWRRKRIPPEGLDLVQEPVLEITGGMID
jgi:hypothetical protein